ncbi:unnamed protein product [Nyctereutes procyonoides]|uniref:(raccoon dog) hypothetical protein n=1 Tax=Nyctereutes procyonoides TaxID=34880 RepID=A0A811XZF2_NYCPR|nr:unnamed protein product [Nyctereutes procyonoides]
MKAQAGLSVILILVPSLSGFQDTFLLAPPNLVSTDEKQIVLGRLGKDVILPCSFESKPKLVGNPHYILKEHSFLMCGMLSVYPHPLITWKMDNTPISESNMGEIESLSLFYVDNMIKITESNLSYKYDLHKMQSENVSLSCELANKQSQSGTAWIIVLSLVTLVLLAICIFYMSKRYHSRRERCSVHTERANTAGAEENQAISAQPATTGN